MPGHLHYGSGDASDLHHLFHAISMPAWRGHGHLGDMTPRVAAADLLSELGRNKEAAILRDTTRHAYLSGDEIRDAHELSAALHAQPLGQQNPTYWNWLHDPYHIGHLSAALDHGMTADRDNDLSDIYGVDDIRPATLAAMFADAEHFASAHADLPAMNFLNQEGRDYHLSRNGHRHLGFHANGERYGHHAPVLQNAAELDHGPYQLREIDPDHVPGTAVANLRGPYEVDPRPPVDENPPDVVTRNTRYGRADYAADQSDVDSLVGQLASPEHNATRWGHGDHNLRLIAADALQDNGRDDEAEHLRAEGRHVMVHHGKVVPARFTTRHIGEVGAELMNHLHEWSEGQYHNPDPKSWRDVSGHAVEGVQDDEDDEDQPLAETGERHPYGTLEVETSFVDPDGWAQDDPVIDHMHHSELGAHLADSVDSEINGYDAGWNTDGTGTEWTPEEHEEHGRVYDDLLQRLRNAPYEEPAPLPRTPPTHNTRYAQHRDTRGYLVLGTHTDGHQGIGQASRDNHALGDPGRIDPDTTDTMPTWGVPDFEYAGGNEFVPYADQSTVDSLLVHVTPAQSHHNLITADALRDNDRHDEADLLGDPHAHVGVTDFVAHPATHLVGSRRAAWGAARTEDEAADALAGHPLDLIRSADRDGRHSRVPDFLSMGRFDLGPGRDYLSVFVHGGGWRGEMGTFEGNILRRYAGDLNSEQLARLVRGLHPDDREMFRRRAGRLMADIAAEPVHPPHLNFLPHLADVSRALDENTPFVPVAGPDTIDHNATRLSRYAGDGEFVPYADQSTIDGLSEQARLDPADHHTRLVLADALEESGDPRGLLLRAHTNAVINGSAEFARRAAKSVAGRDPHLQELRHRRQSTSWLTPAEHAAVVAVLRPHRGPLRAGSDVARRLAAVLPGFHPAVADLTVPREWDDGIGPDAGFAPGYGEVVRATFNPGQGGWSAVFNNPLAAAGGLHPTHTDAILHGIRSNLRYGPVQVDPRTWVAADRDSTPYADPLGGVEGGMERPFPSMRHAARPRPNAGNPGQSPSSRPTPPRPQRADTDPPVEYGMTRYAQAADFLDHIRENPHDHTARMALADHLEENEPHRVTRSTLDFLRTHPGRAWVVEAPNGRVYAGPGRELHDVTANPDAVHTTYFNQEPLADLLAARHGHYNSNVHAQELVEGPLGHAILTHTDQTANDTPRGIVDAFVQHHQDAPNVYHNRISRSYGTGRYADGTPTDPHQTREEALDSVREELIRDHLTPVNPPHDDPTVAEEVHETPGFHDTAQYPDEPTMNARVDYAAPFHPREIHPDLRFTRLGAHLWKHANEDHTDLGELAAQAVRQPADQPLDHMPLHAMRDYLQENPDHPLAQAFNWHTVPESVQLDGVDPRSRHAETPEAQNSWNRVMARDVAARETVEDGRLGVWPGRDGVRVAHENLAADRPYHGLEFPDFDHQAWLAQPDNPHRYEATEYGDAPDDQYAPAGGYGPTEPPPVDDWTPAVHTPPPHIHPNEIHPELRHTRLGAHLWAHATTSGDDVATLARQALLTPHDHPLDTHSLRVMHDVLQDHPEHPLAQSFNWETVADHLDFDRHVRQAVHAAGLFSPWQATTAGGGSGYQRLARSRVVDQLSPEMRDHLYHHPADFDSSLQRLGDQYGSLQEQKRFEGRNAIEARGGPQWDGDEWVFPQPREHDPATEIHRKLVTEPVAEHLRYDRDSEPLAYGLAPREVWGPLVGDFEQARQAWRHSYTPDQNFPGFHLGVVADQLDDHDDPRASITRRYAAWMSDDPAEREHPARRLQEDRDVDTHYPINFVPLHDGTSVSVRGLGHFDDPRSLPNPHGSPGGPVRPARAFTFEWRYPNPIPERGRSGWNDVSAPYTVHEAYALADHFGRHDPAVGDAIRRHLDDYTTPESRPAGPDEFRLRGERPEYTPDGYNDAPQSPADPYGPDEYPPEHLSRYDLGTDPTLYSHEAYLAHIARRPNDATARAVFADWLEENAPHTADPETLDFLRSHQGPAWAAHGPDGKVYAGRRWTMPEIRQVTTAAGSHWFDRDSMRFYGTRIHGQPVHGPGGIYFVTSERGAHDDDPRAFTVRSFGEPRGNFSPRISTFEFRGHPDVQAARAVAARLASGLSVDRVNRNHMWGDFSEAPAADTDPTNLALPDEPVQYDFDDPYGGDSDGPYREPNPGGLSGPLWDGDSDPANKASDSHPVEFDPRGGQYVVRTPFGDRPYRDYMEARRFADRGNRLVPNPQQGLYGRDSEPTFYADYVHAADIHPELAFTRLGAHLLHHANIDPSDVGHLARAAVHQPHDQPYDLMPLNLLRDYLQEQPDHPLAQAFNWVRTPEKVALDRDVHREIVTAVNPDGEPLDHTVSHRDRSGTGNIGFGAFRHWHNSDLRDRHAWANGQGTHMPEVVNSLWRLHARRDGRLNADQWADAFPDSDNAGDWHRELFENNLGMHGEDIQGDHPERYEDDPLDYGLAPDPNQFGPQIRRDMDEGMDDTPGSYFGLHSHDILADHLADHGDPREDVVRNRGWAGVFPAGDTWDWAGALAGVRAWENGGPREFRMPDGTAVQAHPYPAENPRAFVVGWGGSPAHEASIPWYNTPMTREEFEHWMGRFGEGELPPEMTAWAARGYAPERTDHAWDAEPTHYADDPAARFEELTRAGLMGHTGHSFAEVMALEEQLGEHTAEAIRERVSREVLSRKKPPAPPSPEELRLDKKRASARKTAAGMRARTQALPVEDAAQLIARHLAQHGEANRRTLAQRLNLSAAQLDAAISHGRETGLFGVETRAPKRADGKGGRAGTWFVPSPQTGEGERTDYVDHSHENFHAAILENRGDGNPAMVYADWLEDQGQPEAAHIIRSHVADCLHPDRPSFARSWAGGLTKFPGRGPVGPFRVAVVPKWNGEADITLGQHGGPLQWEMTTDRGTAKQLADGIFARGGGAYDWSYEKPPEPPPVDPDTADHNAPMAPSDHLTRNARYSDDEFPLVGPDDAHVEPYTPEPQPEPELSRFAVAHGQFRHALGHGNWAALPDIAAALAAHPPEERDLEAFHAETLPALLRSEMHHASRAFGGGDFARDGGRASRQAADSIRATLDTLRDPLGLPDHLFAQLPAGPDRPRKQWESNVRHPKPHLFARGESPIYYAADLPGLFRNIRVNPYDETLHGVFADALEEAHPNSPIPNLIRRQFGLGDWAATGNDEHDEDHSLGGRHNLYHDPVWNASDGTFPYHAQLHPNGPGLRRHIKTVGPFQVWLGHEAPPRGRTDDPMGPDARWFVHALSTMPGSEDTHYTFEFPHHEAHLIPQMFPAARTHIDPTHPHPWGDIQREWEANEFEGVMHDQEHPDLDDDDDIPDLEELPGGDWHFPGDHTGMGPVEFNTSPDDPTPYSLTLSNHMVGSGSNPYRSGAAMHYVDQDAVESMVRSLSADDRRGPYYTPHNSPADMNKRLVVADALSESGREDEAALLRSNHPVWVEGGRVGGGYGGHLTDGYSAYYTPDHGEVLCHDCMNQRAEADPTETPVVQPHPHWEGPPVECSGCGGDIESSYGDPDEDDADIGPVEFT